MRATGLEMDDERVRTLIGATEAFKLLIAAFLAETARKRVLEASERADIMAIDGILSREDCG